MNGYLNDIICSSITIILRFKTIMCALIHLLTFAELLRNYAETTLVDMVQLLFIQLHSFSDDQYTVDDTASIIDQVP